MATGLQSTNSKRVATVRLVEAATAANGAPTGVPLAVPTAGRGFDLSQLGSAYVFPETAGLRVYSTAGSGTMTCSFIKLWTYSLSSGLWSPVGTGSDGLTIGELNGGDALTETDTDVIRHHELLLYPGMSDGVYIELGTFGGTATALTVELDIPRHRRGGI